MPQLHIERPETGLPYRKEVLPMAKQQDLPFDAQELKKKTGVYHKRRNAGLTRKYPNSPEEVSMPHMPKKTTRH